MKYNILTRSKKLRKDINGNISSIILLLIFILSIAVTTPFKLALSGSIVFPSLFVIYYFFQRKNICKQYFLGLDISILIAFCSYILASILWSEWDAQCQAPIEVIARVCLTLGFVFLFSFIAVENVNINSITTIYVFTFFFVGVFLIVEPLLSDVKFWEYRKLLEREGLFYHSNHIAWIYASVVLLSVSKFTDYLHRKKVRDFIPYVFPLLVSFIVLYFAQSRSADIGLIAGLIFICFSRSRSAFVYGILFLVFGLSVFLLAAKYGDYVLIKSVLYRGGSGREMIYMNAIQEIQKNPFFGKGYASSAENIVNVETVIQHYHSLYLNTLFHGGVIGLLMLVSLIFFTVNLNLFVRSNMGWLSVFIMATVSFVFAGNYVVTYPSAPFYIFIIPILIMSANRFRLDSVSFKRAAN